MAVKCERIFEDIQQIDDLIDVDTTGASTGDFLQKSAGDWVDFGLFAAANTWVLKQTFDPVGGIDLAGGPLLLEGGTTPLIRSSGSGNLDCSVAVGKNFSFFVDGTADVIIAANTITLDQGAVDWILDWTTPAVLKISWAGLGILIAPGGINPATDNAGALGDTSLGYTDLFLADDGAVNFRGSLTHEVGSDAANEVQLRAPNIVNLVVGSTDIVSVAATEVSFDAALQLKEQAAANSNTAAFGQLWVKDDAPNILKYTDDAGTDFTVSMSGGSGSTLTVSTTQVFTGTSPTSMTNLDLSGTVGSNVALVGLSFKSASDMDAIAVRTDGDASDYYSETADASAFGCQLGHHDDTADLVLTVATNSSGVIEWETESAQTCTVDVLWYIA